MLLVENTIRALRREIVGALAEDGPVPDGVQLIADRVVVSLSLRIRAHHEACDGLGSLVIAASAGEDLHRLTIEFRLQSPPAVLAPVVTDREPRSEVGAAAKPADSPAFAGLCDIFGIPGFDSSARATVFRESLQDLSDTQARAVLASLGEARGLEIEPALNLPRHLVQRLACSGPLGPKSGPERLRQLAERTQVSELIRLAAEHWRTQSEWAAGTQRELTI